MEIDKRKLPEGAAGNFEAEMEAQDNPHAIIFGIHESEPIVCMRQGDDIILFGSHELMRAAAEDLVAMADAWEKNGKPVR